MENYLVIDGGGTFTKYALMDENAAILEKNKVPTPGYKDHKKEDYYRMLDGIAEQYRDRIAGIAMSLPGMLDSERGYCVTAGYLAYLSESPVAEELESRYGFPVSIENDGKCAALAEFWQGSLKGCRNGAVVVLGSGVGGGLILNGALYRGSHFSAGEYSYVCANENQSQALDGYWGISGGAPGLAKAVAKYTGTNWEEYDGIRIFQQANDRNLEVLKGLRDFTDSLAVQIYNLNILLDLDCVAIGGGISQQPLLLEYLRESMDALVDNNPIKMISPHIPKPTLTTCRFYNDANLIGALYRFKELKAAA